jgi:hypothetical protein
LFGRTARRRKQVPAIPETRLPVSVAMNTNASVPPKRKALWKAVLSGLLLLCLLVASLPKIVSLAPIKQQLIAAANARLPGELVVETWSLGWFGGIALEGVSYTDAANRIALRGADLRFSKGLLSLLSAPRHLGAVTIRHPQLDLTLLPQAPEPAPDSQGPQPTEAPPPGEPAPSGEKEPAVAGVLPAVTGTFTVEEGVVAAGIEGSPKRTLVTGLQLALAVDQGEADLPVVARMEGTAGDGSGRFSGEGDFSLTLSPEGPVGYFVRSGRITVTQWEIADLLDLAAALGNLPQGAGKLAGEVTLAGDSTEGIAVKGGLNLAEVTLRGGFLGTDTPSLERLTLSTELSHKGGALGISRLELVSPVVKGSLTGDLNDRRHLKLDGEAEIDLAGITEQLPTTLRVREDTSIEEGKLAIKARFESAAETTRFAGEASVGRLIGTSAGKKLRWDEPFSLAVRGEMGAKGWRLDRFTLQSAFLDGEGTGDAERLRVLLRGDLKEGMQKVGQFVRMDDYRFDGKLQSVITLERESEELFDARLQLTVDNLQARHKGRRMVPDHRLQLDLTSKCRLNHGGKIETMLQPQLTFDTWLGKGDLRLERLDFDAQQTLQTAERLRFQGRFDLSYLSPLLSAGGILPDGTGLYGTSNLELSASLGNRQLHLHGAQIDTRGFELKLGERRLADNRFGVRTKGRVDLGDGSLELGPTEVALAPGSVTIEHLAYKPSAPPGSRWEGTASSAMDVARLLASLKDYAVLPNGVRLEGAARLNGAVAGGRGGTQTVSLDLGLESLTLYEGKKRVLSEKSFQAEILGTRTGTKRLTLDRLAVTSNLLSAVAKGSYGKVEGVDQLDGEARLEASLGPLQTLLEAIAGEAAAKIYGSEPVRTNGEADLTLEIGGSPTGLHQLASQLVVEAFSLRRSGEEALPAGRFEAAFSAGMRWGNGFKLQELSQAALTFSSPMGNGTIRSRRFDPSPAAEGVAADGQFDLKRLSGLLQAFSLMPKNRHFGGRSTVRFHGGFDSRRLLIEEVAADSAQFSYRHGEKILRMEQLGITARGEADLGKRRLNLTAIEITMPEGRLRIPRLAVGDWAAIDTALTLKADADLGLSHLQKTIGLLTGIETKTALAGAVRIDLDVTETDTRRQRVMLRSEIKDLKLQPPDGPTLAEDTVKLLVELSRNTGDETALLEQIRMDSRPVSLSASGDYSGSQPKASRFTGQGSLALDLELVEAYLRAFGYDRIAMAGKAERPFEVRIAVADGQSKPLWSETDFRGAFHADRLKAFGIEATSLDVPVRMQNGIARLDIAATVNDGRLSVSPLIDLRPEAPRVTVPEDSLVLSRARLSKAMANELLALIHPVFHGAALVEGLLDFELHRFHWPLPGESGRQPEFAGRLNLQSVSLDASGLLYAALEALKVKEREIDIGDRTIDFVCRNGRIECSPLKLTVGDTTLTLSGSMGLDKSLAYTAAIPVTEKWVGKDLYAYLDDTVIRIPIGGTLTRPSVSTSAIQEILGDLSRQALQKKAGEALQKQAGDLLKKLFD